MVVVKGPFTSHSASYQGRAGADEIGFKQTIALASATAESEVEGTTLANSKLETTETANTNRGTFTN